MEGNELFTGLSEFLKDNNLMNQASFEEEQAKPVSTEKTEEKTEESEKVEENKVPQFTLEELEETEEKEEVTKESEKETKTEESEESDKKPSEKSEEESNVYSLVAQILKEDGLIDTEFKSSDEMLEVFGTAIKNGIDSYKEELPDAIRELINSYEEGVPFDEILNVKSAQIRLDSINEEDLTENVELQKSLYKDYLRSTTQFSDAKIEKEINRLVDLDELLDSSKEAHEYLKELSKEAELEMKERAKQERIEAEEMYREQLNLLNDRVKKTTEIIPGIKISEKEQKELFRAITTPVETRGDELLNQVMLVREKDPVGFEMKLNYYIKLGLFDETPKFDKLTKVAETKTLTKLERQLEDEAKKRITKVGNNRSIGDNADTLDALKKTFKL
jgi:hypothetical protein